MNKVAVFTKTWLGVSETFIFRQLMALDRKKLDSIILASISKEMKEKKQYKGDVYLMDMTRFYFYLSIVFRKFRLKKNGYLASPRQYKFWKEACVRNGVRLIHAHYGPSGLQILKLSREIDVPLVTTFHGNDASSMIKNKELYRRNLQFLFEDSFIITVSNHIRERLIGLGASPERIICHYIGTDLESFSYIAHEPISEKVKRNEKIVFLQVSNFVEKKGHVYTIEVFKLFLELYENSHLVLGGDGHLRNEMEKLVEKLEIGTKVSFLGNVSSEKVAELMRTSDVFLHHSVTGRDGSEEGIPTVLMEAMARGIPVISSSHAGIPELITPECGFLVGERNLNEYFQVLKSLLYTDTRLYALNAFNRVNCYFDIRKQNEKLIEIYTSLIENRRLPGN